MTISSFLSLPPKIFGCVAYVHVQRTQRSKIDPCAIRCVSLGIGINQKGYKCYEPTERKWYTTMDVTFMKNESLFRTSQYSPQEESTSESECVYDPLVFGKEVGARIDSEPLSEPLMVEEYGLIHTLEEIVEDGSPKINDLQTVQRVPSSPQLDSTVQVRVYTRNKTRPVFGVTTNREEQQDDIYVWTEINGNTEEMIQTDQAPQSLRSPEECPTVNSLDSQYQLPPRNNRGKPPKRYVPKDGTSFEYQIANYVSAKHLP